MLADAPRGAAVNHRLTVAGGISVRIPLYQVDAFASNLFTGNPAAVCPLERWLDEPLMQAIAAENNLSETAFFTPRDGDFELRWFTPAREVDLCGHATLASAFVVFQHLDRARGDVRFHTRSGPLEVRRAGELLAMDFPSRAPVASPTPPELVAGLGRTPQETLRSRDYLAVLGSESEVRALEPRMERLMELDTFGVIATAPGDRVDFVSRFFAPRVGVPEDPVTGSAHCTLVPFWSQRLGRTRLQAHQVSPRGGELDCEDRGDRVTLAGRAVLYLEGTIQV
jgi:predicted PhzF superfamily epimerase YddE/YHI9